MSIQADLEHFAKSEEARRLGLEALIIYEQGSASAHVYLASNIARNIYSHTKSFLSAAVGIAIYAGKLSLRNSLADYFYDYIPPQNREKISAIHLKDFLTMSSGFGHPYLMHADRFSANAPLDYVKFLLAKAPVYPAGQHFCYSTADSILAGRMLEKAVGTSLESYLQEHLFRYMDIDLVSWERCPYGHVLGGGGMVLTAQDMAKLGALYLNGGSFSGIAILPMEWIRLSTSTQILVPQEKRPFLFKDYGYHFWKTQYEGSFCAHGSYGQDTFVFPQQGLSVSMQCRENSDEIHIKLRMQEIFSKWI